MKFIYNAQLMWYWLELSIQGLYETNRYSIVQACVWSFDFYFLSHILYKIRPVYNDSYFIFDLLFWPKLGRLTRKRNYFRAQKL